MSIPARFLHPLADRKRIGIEMKYGAESKDRMGGNKPFALPLGYPTEIDGYFNKLRVRLKLGLLVAFLLPVVILSGYFHIAFNSTLKETGKTASGGAGGKPEEYGRAFPPGTRCKYIRHFSRGWLRHQPLAGGHGALSPEFAANERCLR